MNQSPVLTQFVAYWTNYLSEPERVKTVALIVPKLDDTGASPEIEASRRHILLDWAIRTAAPEWLQLAGLTAESNDLTSLDPLTPTPNQDYTRIAATLEVLNPRLAGTVDNLDVGTHASTTRLLRRTAYVAVGVSGTQAAIRAATRPFIDDNHARTVHLTEYTAITAAFINALREHSLTPGPAGMQQAANALHPTTRKLQKSLVTLFDRIINPTAQSPQEQT